MTPSSSFRSVPGHADYFSSVQDPKRCFSDPELRSGRYLRDALDLPVPFSGQNAVVFKFFCDSGVYAVRCFLRLHDTHRERYRYISEVCERASLSCLVPFRYLDEGIRIGESSYPLLVMEWAEGETLIDYVGARLKEPVALSQLAYRFLEVLRDLRTEGIAHGDLQHGNILIDGARLRLVDYDGMYLPSLSGMGSLESGHPNYQHPSRRISAPFDEHLDAFSGWVILLSLMMLAEDPAIWDLVSREAHEDQLLFNAADYRWPMRSPVLTRLVARDDTVGRMARFLRTLMVVGLGCPSPVDFDLPEFSADGAWIGKYLDMVLLRRRAPGIPEKPVPGAPSEVAPDGEVPEPVDEEHKLGAGTGKAVDAGAGVDRGQETADEGELPDWLKASLEEKQPFD